MTMTVAEEARSPILIRIEGEADRGGNVSYTTPEIPVTGKIKIKEGVLTPVAPCAGSATHHLELQVQHPGTAGPPSPGPGYGTVSFTNNCSQSADISIKEIEIGRFQVSVTISGYQMGEMASVRLELYAT
jgi:hypothetical protein